ncbi:MAG: hypothetical protein ACJAYU_004694 [Bradymonadia bacterium]|jgi:hypothetical protein
MHIRAIFVLAACTALAGCAKPEPVNITETGTLAEGDLVLEDDSSLYDEYTFTAAAGMRIVVEMTSDQFDAYVHLAGPNDLHEQNDDFDAAVGTNAKIEYTAVSNGTYRVLANAFGAPSCEGEGEEEVCENVGDYTVTIVTTAAE